MLVLERIRGQLDRPGPSTGEQAWPVDLDAVAERLTKGGEKPPWSTVIRTQRVQRDRVLDRFRHAERERGLGTDFEEHTVPSVGQCAHPVGELDRLDQAAIPVFGVAFRAGQPTRVGGGVHRHGRLSWCDRAERVQ